MKKTSQFNVYLALVVCAAFVLSAGTAHAAKDQPEPKILITNARIFDGKADKLSESMSVLVEGNIIKQISTEPITVDGATVIDGKGLTLMPGLMDMHVHLTWNQGMGVYLYSTLDYIGALALVEAKNTLMRGITTVRDTGGHVKGVQQAIDKGYHVGPRKATHLDELTNRLEWFTPAEILVQATSSGGKLVALSGPRNPYPGKLGVIEEGALADLLLVEGNSLEDIKVMTDPENNRNTPKIIVSTFKVFRPGNRFQLGDFDVVEDFLRRSVYSKPTSSRAANGT